MRACYRIIRTRAHEHTEPPHAFGLLRARNEWNCGGTANKRDKFALAGKASEHLCRISSSSPITIKKLNALLP